MLAAGLIEVDAGFLKMQVSASDVEEMLPPSDASREASGISFPPGAELRRLLSRDQRDRPARRRGLEQVDKLLDSAALAQVERVRIVHGHGMGILKRAIADLLKQNPHVEKFYVAPPEEGGSGATIVELK